ncbi:MAG: shikimate kinase [Kiritimatiellales bacterium]|nr:shikimate kinase [Kiritimatiellales bacterium]
MNKKNIVLVGFMGTGKTTLGRLLAARTGMKLVDMDSIIEERAGKLISDIFAQEGEAHFRQLERALVQELAAESGLVVSTGGGIVLDPDNIADFERTGLVVCLLLSAEAILERVRHDDTRPLLSGDKVEKIRELLEFRRPLYEAIEHRIETDGLTPEQKATQIMELYNAINS